MARTARPEAYSVQQIEIGRRIRQVREFSGDTKAEAARRFGVDPSTFAKIEDGTRAPSVFFVVEISNKYRVVADYFLRGTLDATTDAEMRLKIQAAGEAALARESLRKRKASGMDTGQDGGKSRLTKKLAHAN